MDEICAETYSNIITELTGSDENTHITTLYKSGIKGYDISQSELLSTVLFTLTLGTLVSIHIEDYNDEYEDIIGNISHVFTIVKLDIDRYNIIQTYAGEYSKRKYTTISHLELIQLLLELHEIYISYSLTLVKKFYSKWFYVTLKNVSYPNYLEITTI